MGADDVPPGFVRFTVGRADVVARTSLAEAIGATLRGGPLYDLAARHRDARPLRGRGTVYSIPLPGVAERVVVRRNRHGGMFAALTRDVFRRPTRAPHELRVSEWLRAAGVATPEIAAYVHYPAALALVRVDVVTREVPHAADLSNVIMSDDASRREAALRATGVLLAQLARAQAWHQDLNVKNVLLAPVNGGAPDAFVLDVDRVVRGADPADVMERNLARLFRSARKWRAAHGARVNESDLALVARVARDQPVAATARS